MFISTVHLELSKQIVIRTTYEGVIREPQTDNALFGISHYLPLLISNLQPPISTSPDPRKTRLYHVYLHTLVQTT
jgi:hypothetical protein